MTFLVAFGHKARHGKDTAAAHLAGLYGSEYGIKVYSFGGALKAEMYDVLTDLNHPYWNFSCAAMPEGVVIPVGIKDYVDKVAWVDSNKKALAYALQHYGTEFIRSRDPFYWVKKVHEQIEADAPKFAFITDLRFLNEFLYVKSRKGYTVKCVREGYVDPSRDPNHVSETELDKAAFDFTISVPDGAVEELCRDAEEVFNLILKQIVPDVPEVGDGLTKAA